MAHLALRRRLAGQVNLADKAAPAIEPGMTAAAAEGQPIHAGRPRKLRAAMLIAAVVEKPVEIA
jgi:hypothetical protein